MPVYRDLPDRSGNRRGVTKMPTTYAHDLFGKRVYRKLSAKLQHLIRSNGNLYRIGQHGPDILFYYFISKNPVTQYGVQMHGRKAREFFEKGMAKVREEKNPALMAYLLGFGCHYILDSTCHPYVNQVAAEGKVSHTLFEKEFDRMLMYETGKDPLRFYPSHGIRASFLSAWTIHQVLPAIRTWNIYLSLKMMKIFTCILVCDDGGRKRRLSEHALSPAGKKRSAFITEFFMSPEPEIDCKEELLKLDSLMEEALAKAPDMLEELAALAVRPGHLSDRWDLTFNG